MDFIHVMKNPIKTLNTFEEIDAFLNQKDPDEVRIVGFFYDDDRDESSDFM